MQAYRPDTTIRAIGSSTLFVALFSSLCGIVYLLFRSLSPSYVPDLPKYRLSNKADVIVICYRPGCGCEAHTTIWTGQALERKKQVLLLASKWEPEMDYVREKYAPVGAVVLTTNNQSLLERLSPSGKTTVSRVDYGKIVRQAAGGSALGDVLASDEPGGKL